MAVSRDDVRAVARLARLRLEDEEVERFTEQLNRILEHMESLGELDLDAGEADGVAAETAAPPRPDDSAPDALDRPLQDLAPAWEDGFFTVPRLAALDAGAGVEPTGTDDGSESADSSGGSAAGAPGGGE